MEKVGTEKYKKTIQETKQKQNKTNKYKQTNKQSKKRGGTKAWMKKKENDSLTIVYYVMVCLFCCYLYTKSLTWNIVIT